VYDVTVVGVLFVALARFLVTVSVEQRRPSTKDGQPPSEKGKTRLPVSLRNRIMRLLLGPSSTSPRQNCDTSFYISSIRIHPTLKNSHYHARTTLSENIASNKRVEKKYIVHRGVQFFFFFVST